MAGLLIPFAGAISSCDSDEKTVEELGGVTKMEVVGAQDDLLIMDVADEHQVEVKLLPEDAPGKEAYTYEYSSSNEEIFKVDEKGHITALSPGEAALRIDPVNNTDLWAVVTVQVNEKLFLIESLDIDQKYQNMYAEVGTTIDLAKLITVAPEYASNQNLIYSSDNKTVANVTRRGIVSTLALGDATITIKTEDDSEAELTCVIKVREATLIDLDRTNWTVTTSHKHFADATVVGTPESLIDHPDAYGAKEGEPTCLCLVKPGKSLGGVTVGADEDVFFVIDLKQKETIGSFRLRHRVKNTSKNLRLNKATLLGSNNGTDFTVVAEDVEIDNTVSEATVKLSEMVEYQYIKLVYKGWGSYGSTVQISDFNLSKLEFKTK